MALILTVLLTGERSSIEDNEEYKNSVPINIYIIIIIMREYFAVVENESIW